MMIKKICGYAPLGMCLLMGLVPWVALTAFIGGYTFTLYKPVPSFLILAACTLILTLLFRFSGAITDRLNDILGILCPALSLICGIYFICHAQSLSEFLTFLSCTILCCACGIYLFHEAAPASPIPKVVFGILATLLGLVFAAAAFFSILAGSLSHTELKSSAYSPGGTYVAKVICEDYGATGGATVVQVENNHKKHNIFIGRVIQRPQEIYTGKYGEFKTLKLAWHGEDTLLINGLDFPMESH